MRALFIQGLDVALAQLDDALTNNPNRATALAIARVLRALQQAGAEVYGAAFAADVVTPSVEAARQKVLAVFGTSGWDETALPPTVPPLGSSSGKR